MSAEVRRHQRLNWVPKEQYDAILRELDEARQLAAHWDKAYSDQSYKLANACCTFGVHDCHVWEPRARTAEAERDALRAALVEIRERSAHLRAVRQLAAKALAEPAAPQPEDVCTRPDCRDCEVCPRILAEYDKHQYDEIFADEVYTILADAYPDRVQLPQFDNECADCEVEFGLSEAIISVGDRRYHESCAPSEKARKNPQDPA